MTHPLSPEAFVACYGELFEHSPWVVERAARNISAAGAEDDLHAGLMRVVREASPDEQLALIRAHPELAGKAAVDRTLTAASALEQASAGLDRLIEARSFAARRAACRPERTAIGAPAPG